MHETFFVNFLPFNNDKKKLPKKLRTLPECFVSNYIRPLVNVKPVLRTLSRKKHKIPTSLAH